MNNCPICKSDKNIIKIINVKKFPLLNSAVSKSYKKKLIKNFGKKNLLYPLVVLFCNRCIHTFLKTVPNQKKMNRLYSESYNYASALLNNFKPIRDLKFLYYFKKNKNFFLKKKIKQILEVGCFDGFILYHLKKIGFSVTGCDPSQGANIGKKFGLKIYRIFFNPNFFIKKKKKFDLIFSRHFLEHTKNPKNILRQKRIILKKNGILMLEVPNIKFYLKKGLVEVFSLQHIHGFSEISIRSLLSEEGFKVLKVYKTPENLIVISRKSDSKKNLNLKHKFKIDKFIENFERNKKNIKKNIKSYISKNKKIIFWGGGGFAVAAEYLYSVKSNLIEYIVDTDKKKHNMIFISNNLRIFNPNKILKTNPNLIILTSYYYKEIIKAIKKFKLKISILTIFPKVRLYKNNK